MKKLAQRKPRLASVLLWIVAIIITLLCFTYQDNTGPTYPLRGEFQTSQGAIQFKFSRSENINVALPIVLLDPVPEGINGYVKYQRYKSNDEWQTTSLIRDEFKSSRHGRTETMKGLGTQLPGLPEKAGKYEYFVYVEENGQAPVSITGEKPIYARFKGEVPTWALVIHILLIFASMTIALRTILEAMIDGKFKKLLWATIISLFLGGFIFGPVMQYYAFGVIWSGIPFGYDWTDNKVLVEMVLWILALYLNRGNHRNRGIVYVAGIITIAIYFIPHSIFGSEYNYITNTGTGTTG